MRNFTVIYVPLGKIHPEAWTTFAKNKDGAVRAFRLNRGSIELIHAVTQLPKHFPKQFNQPTGLSK